MIVVSVISVLSGIAIVSFTRSRNESNDTLKKAKVESVAKAYEIGYDASTASYQSLVDSDFSGGGKPVQGEVDYREGPDAPSPTFNTFNVCVTLSNSTDYCRSAIQKR